MDLRTRRGLRRSQRVLLVLVAVWVLNAFDLGFTIHQARSGHFREVNPVAAQLLHQPPIVLFMYKLALLGLGTLILAWARSHTVTELACWLLLACDFYVAVRWFIYYERLLTVVCPGGEHLLP